MKYLVLIEQRGGEIKATSFEALSVAMTLANNDSSQVAALVIGQSAESLAEQLKDKGPATVIAAQAEHLEHYQVMNYTDVAASVIDEYKPEVVLGMASPMGRDLFPRLAARLKAGLITDAVEVIGEGQLDGAVKPFFAGKILGRVLYKSSPLKLMTLRPNSFEALEHSSQAEVKSFAVSSSAHEALKAVEVRAGASRKTDLTEAARIISGGRAMGDADAFKILHECSEQIGATVGASRAAVDSGYASHDMQVGQTGKTVNPNLYIACGISGSIQHMAGMRTSKVVVAVNTDPDAPIFSIANYGIVADLFEVVPEMTKKFKEMGV